MKGIELIFPKASS